MTAQPPHTACPGCGFSASASPNPANALPLATRLNNQFIIGRELGTGGFGITYLAYDIKLRRAVAIKEYFPREQCGREENRVSIAVLRSTSPESYQYGLNKFLEEAQTLARFQDVPGIVNVGSFFEANKTGYIVMDYLQGITLEEYLKRRGDKIPFDEALKILMPILDALKEVHAANLLHRDISPDNIFITKQKQVKLIDFGAARMAARDHSQNFSIILKEGYAPEEQYRSKGKQGPWTDVYALAATMYRCITGILPPQSLDRVAGEEKLQWPSTLDVQIDPAQEKVLLKGLEIKASHRYADAGDFQRAFFNANNPATQEDPPAQVPQTTAPETASKPDPAEAKEDADNIPDKETPARSSAAARSKTKIKKWMALGAMGAVCIVLLQPFFTSFQEGYACQRAQDAQAQAALQNNSRNTMVTDLWDAYLKDFPTGTCSQEAKAYFCSQVTPQYKSGSADPGFIIDPESMCGGWNPKPAENETITYVGECHRCLANGTGKVVWYTDGKLIEIDEGQFQKGHLHGIGSMTFYKDGVQTGSYQGGFENGEEHGTGKSESSKGSSHNGQWENGLFQNGQVTLKYDDGSSFSGTYENGKQKHGTSVYKSGASYTGDFKDNLADGQGELKYADGALFTGSFKAGKRHGPGTMEYAEGGSFSGRWENGEWRNGTITYKNSDSYKGDFKDSKRHGQGTMKYIAGEIFSGRWENDEWRNGTLTYKDGGSYTGDFKETWVRHGEGTKKFKDGSFFTGKFENNKFINGTRTWKDGGSCTGTFKEFQPHGQGYCKWASGSSYVGEYWEGLRHGVGTLKFTDGHTFKGRFIKDKPQGIMTRYKNGRKTYETWKEGKRID